MQHNDNFFTAAGILPEHIFRTAGVPIADFYEKCHSIDDVVAAFYDITDEQAIITFVSDMYSFMVGSQYYRDSDRSPSSDHFYLVILQDLLVRMRSYVVTKHEKRQAEEMIRKGKARMTPKR